MRAMNTAVSMCSPAALTAFKRKLARVDPVLANLMRAAGKFTHVPNMEHTPFHTLARAIAHQQLNGIAAESIFGRFLGLYSTDGRAAALLEAQLVLDTPDDKLRAVGLSFAKIAGIKDLARKTIDETVPPYEILHTLADDEIIERITQVRGIGRWTVEMMLMFRLGRPDILPVDDFGVRNGFRLAYGLRGMPTTRALARLRRALVAVSLGSRLVSVARRRSASRRQTTRAGNAYAREAREEIEEEAGAWRSEEVEAGQGTARAARLVHQPDPGAAWIGGRFHLAGLVVPGDHLHVAPLARALSQRVTARLEFLALLGRQRIGFELQHVGRKLVMEARRADDFLRALAVHEIQCAE